MWYTFPMKRENEFDFVDKDDREIFGTFWDVIVFGAGYAGYAAAGLYWKPYYGGIAKRGLRSSHCR